MVAVNGAVRSFATAGAGVRLGVGPSREEIASFHLMDEVRLVGGLVERAVYTEDERRRIGEIARQLVHAARRNQHRHGGIDAFMREYGLSSEEGVILMCVAESLLRIPDTETADKLIAEKIGGGAWEKHLGHSQSWLVNASTWGLLLTGRIVKLRENAGGSNAVSSLKRMVARSGEPLIRQAIRQAVRLMGDQFVLGSTIQEALGRAAAFERRGYALSYDMLGEAARTDRDAERYFERYLSAIGAIGRAAGPMANQHPDALMRRPGVSIKLSALDPRFEAGREAILEPRGLLRLIELVAEAREQGLPVTIDAEEQDRLDITLQMFAAAYLHPVLAGWHGLGIAVQAYSRRAIPVLRWLRRLAEAEGRRIPVRLVKGAYWDSEIKWAQERGLEDYPVFTRKLFTDVSYLAAARTLLADRRAFYAQLATHNAHSLAAGYVAAGNASFEFQRLHGMGEALYDEVVGEDKLACACRIYAPVGGHEDLLPYLVRRLLENGANTSFVNRLADEDSDIAAMIADPIETAERERLKGPVSLAIPRPRDIFFPARRASSGLALYESGVRDGLVAEMGEVLVQPIAGAPLIGGTPGGAGADERLVTCPHDIRQRLGTIRFSTAADVEAAIAGADGAAAEWEAAPATLRAEILAHAAELFEKERASLMAVIVREAGKTLVGAHDDVREAVDFLRYYAGEARRLFSEPRRLKGPTGEENELTLRGRGVFASISPWNFPLAIFTGQAAAALAAGNAVIAKPAEQTGLTAFLAVRLLHQAGVPVNALQLLPGDGSVGAALVSDPRIAGVVFTGSTETAWQINRKLAERRGAIVPFIAETGGLNAMIADSSALPEHVVRDCLRSAFDSAGQRCSAARVLFLQEEIAGRAMEMLAGAVEELVIGDPMDYATDIGPVIDDAAQDLLDAHKIRMRREARQLVDLPLPEACQAGSYVTPAVYEIGGLGTLTEETFGPILHVARFEKGSLDRVIGALNATGYGLTLGLHSRIGAVADYVARHARVGNLYVNRNQIGAVVGVQPFGGEGMSGTGPKAGGPNYVQRFATERVRTTDITATGGNLELLRQVVPDER